MLMRAQVIGTMRAGPLRLWPTQDYITGRVTADAQTPFHFEPDANDALALAGFPPGACFVTVPEGATVHWDDEQDDAAAAEHGHG